MSADEPADEPEPALAPADQRANEPTDRRAIEPVNEPPPRASSVERAPTKLLRAWPVIALALVVAIFALRACVHTDPIDNLTRVANDAADPKGTVAYQGSVFIARGGPVIIGFQSDAPARLTFAGKEIRGKGVVKERIVVLHGPAALRFAAPPGARLVWSPVGRRGDPEYLPAASLSPAPPESATFDAPGTTRSDGLFMLMLVAVAVASACMLCRDRLARVPRRTWIAMGTVLVGALLVRWIGLDDAGQTWDEDVNWAAGKNYVSNLLALDFRATSWQWNFEHPPVMKLLAGIGGHLQDGFTAARAFSSLWVALGCALLVPIGARLYSLRAGAIAGGIAAVLPPLVAHARVIGHESPTVLWWTLGILLALTVHDGPVHRKQLVARLAGVGVVVGIAVASRFVNGLLGPLCALIVVVQAPKEGRRATLGWGALVMPLAAVAPVYVLWPRLWAHPIAALQASLAKLDTLHSPEPFLGALTNQPGPHYFLVYLAATLPVGVALAVIAFAVRAAIERNRAALLVGACFLFPLVIMASPVRQDGLRYVMPCVVALALAGGVGADFIATRLSRWVLAPLALYLLVVVIRTHPYHLDYFNELTGGAAAVTRAKSFETAWWGEGLPPALAYVNEHAAPRAKVQRCIEPSHLAWFREDLWDPPTKPDWVVVYAPHKQPCSIPKDLHVVFEEVHHGLVYARVYGR